MICKAFRAFSKRHLWSAVTGVRTEGSMNFEARYCDRSHHQYSILRYVNKSEKPTETTPGPLDLWILERTNGRVIYPRTIVSLGSPIW